MSGIGQSEEGVASTSGMMETSMMEGEEYYNPGDTSTWTQKEMSEQLCRICSKPNQYLIPIFEGEGIEHQLESKIQKHLPIEVLETDELPLQVCYQCASTLIAWNDLVIACIEADKKLRQLFQHHEDQDDKGAEFFDEPILDSDEGEEPTHQSTSPATVISDSQTEILSTKRSPGKAKKSKLQTALLKSSTAGPSGHKPLSKKTVVSSQDDAVQEGTERVPQPTFTTYLQEVKLEPFDERDTPLTHPSVQSKANFLFNHRSGIGKQRFCCSTCDTVFTRGCDLSRHEKRKHPKIKKLLIKPVVNHKDEHNKIVARDSFVRHESDYYNHSSESETIVKDQTSKCKVPILQESIKSETGTDFESDLFSNNGVKSKNYDEKSSGNVKTKKKRKSRLSESQLATVAQAKIIVGDKTLFHCHECGKNLLHQFSYLTHLRIHTGEKPFTCHVCGRQFRTASQLVRHVNDVHEGIKNHPCDICGRMFAHARARNEHRRTHTEERPCICHVCGKAFRTKASLYVHNTFHMDVFKYQCPHCDRQFRRRQEWSDHIMIHTGEKPFACGTCTKSFRQRQELKRHQLTHSSEKPFECPTCKQCFSQKRYLRNHSKTHITNQ